MVDCDVIKRNESYVGNIDFEIYYSYEIPFVSYCFQLDKNISPILMRFSAKHSSLRAFTNELQN